MNPYNQFGKSFLTSRNPDNSQPVNNSNAIPHPRNEGVNIPLPIQLLGLQNSRLSDPNNSQRAIPNYDSLNHPTKRVRHSQDNFSEVNREPQQLPNDIRPSGRLEDQLQARLAMKTADDDFISQNAGLRKPQGSLPLGVQDSSVFSSNPNIRDYANLMLTKQLMDKYQKGVMLRENAPNQIPFPVQNEASLFSLLANNINLANLVPNAPNLNNAFVFDLLRQIEQQQAMHQLTHYLQLNQQIFHNLQDAAQTNAHQKSPPTGSNSSMPRIPPLNPMTQFERMAASTGTPKGIGPLIRPELRDKAQASSFIKEGFKKSNSGQLIEKPDRELKIEIPVPVKEERVEQPEINGLETITTQDQIDEDNLSKNDNNKREEEKTPFYGYKDIPTMQIVSKKAKVPQRDVLDVPVAPKKVRDARGKNRWQMMLEKQDKVDDNDLHNSGTSHKDRRSILNERAERGGSNALRPLKPRNYDKENQEGNIDNDDYEMAKARSSVHKKKKKGSTHKNKAALKNNDDIYQDGMDQGMYSTSTNLNIPGEDNGCIRISSSFGKTSDDYMLREGEEQRIVDLHVGDEYQAQILELDLNANGSLEKRIPKMLWDPEGFDEETLSDYYTKLQKILGCKGINEEKAIKMLIKKNLVPEEVIVTIKKNEKFYLNYLGNAQLEKDLKAKKGSMDIK